MDVASVNAVLKWPARQVTAIVLVECHRENRGLHSL